jgi:hypothetical protein
MIVGRVMHMGVRSWRYCGKATFDFWGTPGDELSDIAWKIFRRLPYHHSVSNLIPADSKLLLK